MKITQNLSARLAAVLVALAAVAFFAAGTSPASAGGGDDDSGHQGGLDDRVIRTGDCTGAATWKLKVTSDDGRVEVEGEVDANQAGQAWDWSISDNGATVSQSASTTTSRSGSFSVERKVANRADADRIVLRATNGDQACQGVVTS